MFLKCNTNKGEISSLQSQVNMQQDLIHKYYQDNKQQRHQINNLKHILESFEPHMCKSNCSTPI